MGNSLFAPERTDDPILDQYSKTLVFVEGNISSGKSTLIEGLRDRGYPVWTEAVDRLTNEYTNKDGQNILELFYHEMREYSFKLQVASLTTRWKIIKEALAHLNDACLDSETSSDDDDQEKSRIAFVERSLLTDYYSFAQNLYDQGHIDDLEWKIYLNLLHGHLLDAVPHFRDVNIVFLYLKTDPQECFERTERRSRQEESTIELEYLNMLHAKNERWLIGSTSLTKLIVDGHQSKEDVMAETIKEVHKLHTQPEQSGAELLFSEIRRSIIQEPIE